MIGNIDHFVNRQILLWQEERKIAARKGIEGKNAQQPMICLSRQYGARGAEMGRMVADAAGVPVLLPGADPRRRPGGARAGAAGRVARRAGAGQHLGLGVGPHQARRLRPQ